MIKAAKTDALKCEMSSVRQPKVKFFLPTSKLMKRPQTKFHTHTMRESQVIRSNKVKVIIGSNFSCNTVFFLFIDILVKLQQQILICFCKF